MHTSTCIDINAPAETIWRALMDFENYPSWNPFVIQAVSEDRRTVHVHLDPGGDERCVSLDVRIKKARAPQLIEASLIYGPSGLMGGRYALKLEDAGNRVRVTQDVALTGILRPLYVSDAFLAKTERGLRAMGMALQRICKD